MPLTVTVTLSNDVGSCPFVMSFPDQSRVVSLRFVPLMVNHEFCIMPGWKLAPFTTPPAAMDGFELVAAAGVSGTLVV